MLLRFYLALVLFALACAGLAAALGRRETATRCLTLAGLVSLLCAAMAGGVWIFAGLLGLTAELAARELAELDEQAGASVRLSATIYGVLLVVILVPPTNTIVGAIAAVSVTAAISAARLLMRPREAKRVPSTAVVLLAVHVCAGLAAIALMYRMQLGLLLATIVMMQFNDGFAYLVGRTWGRTKLAPNTSPGKSIEGLLGGALASGVVLWICHTELFPLLRGQSWVHGVGLWAIVVGVGVLGDLLYSLAKRRASLDDYGSSLPGHGGVLDRVDSLLACAPVTLAWHLWMGS